MAMIEWSIEGKEFGNCNCAYGCPCQFNALPTHGSCEAVNAFQIDRGHFGDVPLDGLRAVGTYQWPGPVHLGNGTMQLIVDERANARQREALVRIMTGQETTDMATMWWVYSAMCSTKLEALFLPIALELDMDARSATLSVPGVVESAGQPIRNPVTGAEHRARIELPHGFEYRLAECASGRTRASGQIKLDMKDTHAHFCAINMDNNGIIERAHV